MKKIKEGNIPSAPDDLQKLIDQYDRSEVEMGMDIEQEHNGGKTLDVSKSPLDTLKIVLAHMKEDPMYYTHLKGMEDKNKVDEGTTSRSSFEYDKSPTNTYKAPEMNPRHFAQDGEVHTEMGDETEMNREEIQHPDPQYASSSRVRREGDSENKKLKGRDLLWDDEQGDDEEIDDENLGEEIARMIRAMKGIEQ